MEVDGQLVAVWMAVHLGPENQIQGETELELDVVEESFLTLVVSLHAVRRL